MSRIPLPLIAALALGRPAQAAPPRLVAVYELAQATVGAPSTWLWRPATGMVDACGPAKGPVGLGRFEAEIAAHAQAPTLAVLLDTSGQPEPLGPDTLRVSVGEGEQRVMLQPMVEPRALAVSVTGTGDPAGLVRATQLVATQLSMELCLEHKVGRAWLGGDTDSLRQAFLLDPAEGGRDDRRAFGGQRDPVPALTGPPDACADPASGLPVASAPGGRGEGTLQLVPSDVWGASLRACGPEERGGAPWVNPPRSLRLRGTDEGEIPPTRIHPQWRGLRVEIAASSDDAQTRVTVSLDEAVLIQDGLLFPSGAGGGLTDLLAAVPYAYPRLGPTEDPGRYTALLIPGWQLVEAARRLEAGAADRARPTAGPENQDGVAWILNHPELLWVQVPGEGDGERWLDLMEPARPGLLGSRAWGYAVGLLAGRSPIALPTDDPPPVDLALAAQRATPHALFLLSLGVLGLSVTAGLRRLPELWLPQPEERADYWPGAEEPPEEEPSAGSPELNVVEGG